MPEPELLYGSEEPIPEVVPVEPIPAVVLVGSLPRWCFSASYAAAPPAPAKPASLP